ncbi:MAG: SDR family oxidoreductase [Candidatus Eremiobacteraeota bacterium]|nr:SDR family oxidoreductase [Candidatus Eremiobacteraeota bacterium]
MISVGATVVTGASGRVGASIVRKASAQGLELCGLYHCRCLTSPGIEAYQADIADRRSLFTLLDRIRPEKIIHCAAIAHDDEEERLRCVNIEGTANLAEYCKAHGAYLVHLSTDLVFDGEKGRYREDDELSPVGRYPLSKARAEEAVRESGARASIARIPINYGWSRDGTTFAEWILSRMRQGVQVPLFVDQFRSPIYLGNLAEALLELARRECPGTFHLAGADRITRYDFGLRMADLFRFPRELLAGVKMEEVAYRGSRSKDCSLDVTKARSLLATPLLGVEEGLRAFKEEEGQAVMP